MLNVLFHGTTMLSAVSSVKKECRARRFGVSPEIMLTMSSSIDRNANHGYIHTSGSLNKLPNGTHVPLQ